MPAQGKPTDYMGEHMLKRALIGSVAAVTLATGGTLAYSAAANATTTHQPSRGFMRALVTGATFTIDGVTLRARPVSVAIGQYPTRGYRRTCEAFARWNAAGIPSWGQLRTLAHDAARLEQGPHMLPNDTLQADVAALVLTVIGRTGGSRQAVIVAHDCRQN